MSKLIKSVLLLSTLSISMPIFCMQRKKNQITPLIAITKCQIPQKKKRFPSKCTQYCLRLFYTFIKESLEIQNEITRLKIKHRI